MRVPYADPTQLTDPADAAIVQRVEQRRHPRPLQPLDLALLRAPPVADGWNAFLGAIRTRTTLPDAVRELAICRVAVCNGAWYEWGHHAPLAVAAGVGEGAMELVRREDVRSVGKEEREEVGMGEREWAAVLLTDESTRAVKVSDETFGECRRLLGERMVVELVATVAAYNCVSRFLVALDVGERNNTTPDDAH